MSDTEEMVDVELKLGKEQADVILKLNKSELTNRLVIMILRNHVQDETVEKLEKELLFFKDKIRKSVDDTKQAKQMIQVITSSWG